MITSVQFENFKSLRDVTVKLEPLTVLLGANGSGKSSVLEGLRYLLGFVADLDQFGFPTDRDFLDWFVGDRHPGRLVGRPAGDRFRLTMAGLNFQGIGIGFAALAPGQSFDPYWWGSEEIPLRPPRKAPGVEASWIEASQAGVGRVATLNVTYRVAAAPHVAQELETRVAPDGSGLATVLRRLQLGRDGRFEQVEQVLASIIPAVQRLRVVDVTVEHETQHRFNLLDQVVALPGSRTAIASRIEADMRGVGWVPADQLSEGTLLTLCLLTVLIDEKPGMLLLDDLGQSLHPAAQGTLITQLRQIQEQHAVQIVATSHSPYIVDHFAIEEVRVMRLLESGASICRPLSDHPKWEKRKGLLKPGEFWAGVGEDWLGT